jgi:FkbM family methyltransferase
MEQNIKKLFKPVSNSIIIDIGAFVGTSTLMFNEWYPNSAIFAVEACPKNFKVMKKKVANTSIMPIHAAICNNTGDIEFFVVDDSKCQGTHEGTSSRSNSIFKAFTKHKRFKNRQKVKVPAFTLTDFCDFHNIKHIDLLKVNCEGCEYEIFKNPNNLTILNHTNMIAVQFHGKRSPFSSKEYVTLKRKIFKIFHKHEFTLKFGKEDPNIRTHLNQIWVKEH